MCKHRVSMYDRPMYFLPYSPLLQYTGVVENMVYDIWNHIKSLSDSKPLNHYEVFTKVQKHVILEKVLYTRSGSWLMRGLRKNSAGGCIAGFLLIISFCIWKGPGFFLKVENDRVGKIRLFLDAYAAGDLRALDPLGVIEEAFTRAHKKVYKNVPKRNWHGWSWLIFN